jgi:type IV secretion system protein VirD4
MTRKLRIAGWATAAFLVAGWLLWQTAPALLLLLLALVVGVGGMWVVARFAGTARTVTRWGERTRRRSGVATPLQVARVASGWAMHRKAAAVRPHLREVTRRERRKTPTQELGVELCRTAGMRVWASVEDVVFICGGPRSGKTALLGNLVIDAPGAVVTTSTRTDVLEATQALRAKKGPVSIYNPGGLGELPSTISFDPVHGCENPTTAIERAADMIPEKDDDRGEKAHWDAQSRRVFAALLHAAGLSGGTRGSHDVLRWVANPDQSAAEVQLLLRRSPVPSFGPDVEQFVGTNPTTRSSITSGVMPALQWLNSPTAVASTKGSAPFDVAEMLRSRGTVYLLGRHEANTAPLLAALTGYIAREARRLAALPSFEGACRGRLDPPLTLPLDEAARVSPVPLPDWTGDFGGSGIQLILAFQSRADVIDRYGQSGAAKILNNSGTAMYLGGNKDAAGNGDLEFWSKLAGDRDEPVKTRNGDGKVTSASVRKTPVLPVAQLANLPLWRAVVFTRGMPVVIGRISRVWERADVRAAARCAQASPTHPATHVVSHPAPTPAKALAHPGVPAAHPPARELTDVAH